ncbi:hypothetical protein CLAIMM_05343 [Cladophialophora immunda]|nr:hypothetical protein CLAIMM_05343 [Cladophialophora immunda]
MDWQGAARFWTYFYHEMLYRNTVDPLGTIIKATDDESVVAQLNQFARTKADESKYIQLAGGFVFTTVATCLTWPATNRGHWSGAALFYCSILFALIAIVCGSQQLLVLPTADKTAVLPTPSRPMALADAMAIKERLTVSGQFRHPNAAAAHHRPFPEDLKVGFVFSLQAPIMLLTFSTMTFLAGLCSVVFSPLARDLRWNDEAKIAVVFLVVALITLTVFISTSRLIHKLFKGV